MPGFGPVGSLPVGATTSGSSGLNFEIAHGTLVYTGQSASLTITIVAPRVTWFGVEVANTGDAYGRATWMGVEVTNTGDAYGRMTFLAVEVISPVNRAPILHQTPSAPLRRIFNDERDDSNWTPPPRGFLAPPPSAAVLTRPWLFVIG
jgi:hypothetical protein